MLTNKEFTRLGGLQCPGCNSTNLEADRVEADGSDAWGKVHCLDCGATWNDIYKLAGYDDFEKEEK